MSLLPPRNPDEDRGQVEQMFLTEILKHIEDNTSPKSEYGVRHLRQMLELAKDVTFATEVRQRFEEWFGIEEASCVIMTLHPFFDTYYRECLTVGKLLPFSFTSPEQQQIITNLLTRWREQMRITNKGTPLWPPLRPGDTYP